MANKSFNGTYNEDQKTITFHNIPNGKYHAIVDYTAPGSNDKITVARNNDITVKGGVNVSAFSVLDRSAIIVPVSVTGITCPDSLSITFGSNPDDVKPLASLVQVIPEDATNKSVTYQSSNTSVATVDDEGNLTILQAGSTVVTVTTVDGNYSAEIPITIPSQKIELNMIDADGNILNSSGLKTSLLKAKLINQNGEKTYTASVSTIMGSSGMEEYFSFANVNPGTYNVSIEYNGSPISYVPEDDAAVPVISFIGKKVIMDIYVNIIHVESVLVETSTVYVDSINRVNPECSTVNLSELVKVYPENATNKEVEFTIGNSDYGTIKNGILTVLKPPAVDNIIDVRCTSVDGSINADEKIRVKCGVGTISIYPLNADGGRYIYTTEAGKSMRYWACSLFEESYYQNYITNNNGERPAYDDPNVVNWTGAKATSTYGHIYFSPAPYRPLSSKLVAAIYRDCNTNPSFVADINDIVLGESGTSEDIYREITIIL